VRGRTSLTVIIRRLQLLRATPPARVKVISDNPKHAAEEAALGEIEIVSKALCCLKFALSPIEKSREAKSGRVTVREPSCSRRWLPLSVADGFQARVCGQPQVGLFQCSATTILHRRSDGPHGDARDIAAL
jgi:hypothetical protein